jgi:hypothetical protein
MKIISQVDPKTWNLKVTCAECDSTLEIDYNDIIMNFIKEYDNDSNYEYTSNKEEYMTKCVVCFSSIIVCNDAIPRLIRKIVKANDK